MDRRTYTCWAIIEPADDVPDTWTAHCLEFDVVSVGNSAEHAVDMVVEAAAIVIEEALNDGRDPICPAPRECWEMLERIQTYGKDGTIQDAVELAKRQKVVLAVPLKLTFTKIGADREMGFDTAFHPPRSYVAVANTVTVSMTC